MSTPTERTSILYTLHQWLGNPRLTDKAACNTLNLVSTTELSVPNIKPTRREVDELITLGGRIVARCKATMSHTPPGEADLPFETNNDNTKPFGVTGDTSHPEMIFSASVAFTSGPAQDRVIELDLHDAFWHVDTTPAGKTAKRDGRLLDVRACYDRNLGSWPADAESLAATHMNQSE
ncbi:hypothetical protein KEM56_001345, partial [Ascosphaera pollenicola]